MITFDPLFAVVDTKLRGGCHIIPSDQVNWSFISDNSEELSSFYSNYRADLVLTPEQVFYLRPKANALLGRTTLTSLEMLVGRLLCYMYLNLHNFDKTLSGWMQFDVFVSEFKSVVTNEKLSEVYKSKDAFTDTELGRLIERLKTVIRRFKRWGFVQVSESDGFALNITPAILRFAADAAGQDDVKEIQRLLLKEGEICNLDAEVADYVQTDEEDATEEQLDLLGEGNE